MGKGLHRQERKAKRDRVEHVLCEPTPEAVAYFQSLSSSPTPQSDLHRRLLLRSVEQRS